VDDPIPLKNGPNPRNDPQVQGVTEISDAGAFVNPKVVTLQPGGDKETKRYLEADGRVVIADIDPAKTIENIVDELFSSFFLREVARH
jgi:hypothetical protein